MNRWVIIFLILTIFLPAVPGVQAGVNTSNSLSGIQILPADNIWNVPITSLPVDARSDMYLQAIGTRPFVMYDGYYLNILDDTTGIPPQYLSHITWLPSSDNIPYPIPTPVQIQPSTDPDQIIDIYDRDTNTYYHLYHAAQASDGTWSADMANAHNMSSNEIRLGKNLPEVQGLYKYDEVVSGTIHHAIRATITHTNESYVWPYFFHNFDGNTNGTFPPVGQRFRLKSSVDISGYPPMAKAIAQAMKTYGIIATDEHGPYTGIQILGQHDERWCSVYDTECDLNALYALRNTDFEAVDTSSLMISRNSMQARVNSTAVSAPIALFSATPLSGKPPLTVVFTDDSTNTPTEWDWNFGDGSAWVNGTTESLSHTYNVVDNYTATLVVSNSEGCDQTQRTITITCGSEVVPLPGFSHPPTDPDGDCTYEDLNGNDIADWDDAVELFWFTDWIQENEPVASFDFNHNGLIDWDDAVVLFFTA